MYAKVMMQFLRCGYFLIFQLFRRVAAALPGMEITEKKPEDSILAHLYMIQAWHAHTV